ncbi:SDR family oxidoreductase [Paenalkalicoccus suaedae]|uniref:SDR family oxidoreductase n=1 Tax=Paenalkalicoccus suaedae TaxID=2592382 RepID=A0A859FCI7_9BACI|nr:SDR family oxidoreductase [Paenalkalicoccus suaedae]QKS70650.1 SDR family oxidoreductase [Paenalkalicoccus suaedae]
MNVLVIGANGQIGKHIVKMLGLSTQHNVKAMIRKEEQISTMEELGADSIVIGDLEEDFSHAFSDVDAVIFTAGSGGDTGKDMTEKIDREAAIKSVEYAENSNVKRYVMISSIGADAPEKADDNIRHYIEAKRAADDALKESGLTYTILRPGPLSNDDGQGTVKATKKLDSYDGSIPREDVANVAVNVLTLDETYNEIIELLSGDTAIGEALKTFK